MQAVTGAANDPRWTRLEKLLAELQPGQSITIRSVVTRTGLDVHSVLTVLQALTRAELFERIDGTTYVRDSLFSNAGVHADETSNTVE
jgi:hypothetical protein